MDKKPKAPQTRAEEMEDDYLSNSLQRSIGSMEGYMNDIERRLTEVEEYVFDDHEDADETVSVTGYFKEDGFHPIVQPDTITPQQIQQLCKEYDLVDSYIHHVRWETPHGLDADNPIINALVEQKNIIKSKVGEQAIADYKEKQQMQKEIDILYRNSVRKDELKTLKILYAIVCVTLASTILCTLFLSL